MKRRYWLALAFVLLVIGVACIAWYLASCGGDWFTPTTCGSGR